jgi:hypothetical protein
MYVFPEPSVVEAMNRERREKEEQEKSERVIFTCLPFAL